MFKQSLRFQCAKKKMETTEQKIFQKYNFLEMKKISAHVQHNDFLCYNQSTIWKHENFVLFGQDSLLMGFVVVQLVIFAPA